MLALLVLAVWLYLFFLHGSFWRSQPQLSPAAAPATPDVDVVVPARDEAATIAAVIASLLAQDYAGRFRLILVDDGSTDGTADAAGAAPALTVVAAPPKPPGWSGKLWALQQGIEAGRAPLLLFTDADIVHDPRHLTTLVAHQQQASLDLVSEMVHLNCVSFAERALVPAFVYFFQMLYPFSRVNDPRARIAAAAGGTVLIRRAALTHIGGIAAIRGALIDDVSLARAVKPVGAIYLGHSTLARSIRPYPRFLDLWRMIARTAFTQLRHSGLLLLVTVLGLVLVWWLPLFEAWHASGWRRVAATTACLLALASYQPTLRRYRRTPLWALALPLIAGFYLAATLGSALTHWFGGGAEWKQRAYSAPD